MKTLVVGVGNPTRRDDGAGVEIAGRIAAMGLDDVEVRTAQQLQVEFVDEWSHAGRVVVVDAAISGPEVDFRPLTVEEPDEVRSSHDFSPSVLLNLTRRLAGHSPELILCTVRGEEYGFGEGLSPSMTVRVNQAVGRIVHWIRASSGRPDDGDRNWQYSETGA